MGYTIEERALSVEELLHIAAKPTSEAALSGTAAFRQSQRIRFATGRTAG